MVPVPAGLAQTQVYALLHSFNGVDGANPDTDLVQGRDGALYGTTQYGGTANLGTIFKVNRDGSHFSVIYSFLGPARDGSLPLGVIEASDGALYGVTELGGSEKVGTLFKLDENGSNYVVLGSFSGANGGGIKPYAAVIEGSDGALYGTTYMGGEWNEGAMFRVNKDASSFALVHSFQNVAGDGAYPFAALLEASDGALYGTTVNGGNNTLGTVYKMNKDGSNFAVLHSFGIGAAGAGGASPRARLTEGSDGALYGTAQSTVFKLSNNGTGFTVLHTFPNIFAGDGMYAYARLLEGSDGVFYSTTWSGGSTATNGIIFKLNKDGTGYTVMRSFGTSVGDGRNPATAPFEGADGALYGTTYNGGSGYGTVFRITGPGTPSLSIQLTTANTAVVSWPSPSSEFSLQESFSLGSSNWTGVNQTPGNNGVTKSVNISVTSNPKYYRLKSL